MRVPIKTDRVIKLASRGIGPRNTTGNLIPECVKKIEMPTSWQFIYLLTRGPISHFNHTGDDMVNIDKEKSQSVIHPKTTLAPVDCLHSSAMGVDVHSQILVCYYECFNPDTEVLNYDLQKFATSNSGLLKFAQWAKSIQPEVILMESTGVYWMSPYEALEEIGFNDQQLVLVKATEVKAARGRKTDKTDAQRLAQYARMGSYRGSFIPNRTIRQSRVIGRLLHKATQDTIRQKNRYHKLFSTYGNRMSSVFSDIQGKHATIIIDSFLDDDEQTFRATVRKNCSRLKHSADQILDAFKQLSPQARRVMLKERQIYRQALENQRDLELLLEESVQDHQELVDRLSQIPGIKELTARKIVSEIGPDLSNFKNIEAFSSWAGLCPGNNESAGKRRGSKTPKGSTYIKKYLVEAAQSIGLIKKMNTELRKSFQAIKERRGHNRAVVAMAHKLLRIIYALITKNARYVEMPCKTLKKVRLERLVRDVKNAHEVGLSVGKGGVILDLESGLVLGA